MANTVNYNGFPISVDTPLGQELMKWEKKADWRPENNPYPKMLFKAFKVEGVVRCMDVEPNQFLFADMGQYQRAIDRVQSFNKSCQKTVMNEDEHKAAEAEGWRETPVKAEEAQMHWEHQMQQAAAERAHADRNMSEKAKAEIAAAEVATLDPLVEVPVKRRGPGRPPKVSSEAA